jgi:putative flippase GtrA
VILLSNEDVNHRCSVAVELCWLLLDVPMSSAGILAVVRWGSVGVIAAVAELGLLKLLVDVLLWPLPVATAIAAETFILLKFVVSDRWVFGHARPTMPRLLRYHGACAGALVVYWLVINGLTVLLGLAYEIGFVLGTAASFVWSLLTNFLWVWARPRPTPSGVSQHKDPTCAVGYD